MAPNAKSMTREELISENKRLKKEIHTMRFYITYREAIATTTLDNLIYPCAGSKGVITFGQSESYKARCRELNSWVHAMWPGTKRPSKPGALLKYPWDKTNPIYSSAKKHLQAKKNGRENNFVYKNDVTKDLEHYIHLVDQRQNRPNVTYDEHGRRPNPLPPSTNKKSPTKK